MGIYLGIQKDPGMKHFLGFKGNFFTFISKYSNLDSRNFLPVIG
jgi:hypothetical protein